MNSEHIDEFMHALIDVTWKNEFEEEININQYENEILEIGPEAHTFWNQPEEDEDETESSKQKKDIDLSHYINATLSSYDEFSETANIRNQKEKNVICGGMLKKSLEEPTVLLDAGDADGRRLYDILEALPEHAKKNIIQVYGIEYNPAAIEKAAKLFQGTRYNFIPINNRIEDVDFDLIGKIHANEASKKVILGLENIFLNFNGLSFRHKEGLTGFLSRIINPKDEIILEVHNQAPEDNYIAKVEKWFYKYCHNLGLLNKLGGNLNAEYTEEGKRVFIEGVKDSINYKGKEIKITKDKNDKNSRIYLGFSGAIPYQRMFEFLVFNFANNLYVQNMDDIKYTENDTIIKFREYEHKKWIPHAMKKSKSFEYADMTLKGFIPYVVLQELFPHYYKKVFYNRSKVNGVPKKAMKEFTRRNHFSSRKVFPPTSSEKLRFDENQSYF